MNPASGVRTKSGRFFVPKCEVRWVSLMDVPGYSFRIARPPEVHWAAVHRTKIRFGMPTIAGKPDLAFNIRTDPKYAIPASGYGDGQQQPDLFRVFNALNWAMTSTAFAYREAWVGKRQDLDAAIGKEFRASPRALLFGENHHDSLVAPAVWMPRAYLAFNNRHWDRIFGWATKSWLANGRLHYPDAVKQQFCADLGKSMPVQVPFSGRFVGAFRTLFHGLPTFDLAFELGHSGRRVLRVCQHAKVLVRQSQAVKEGETIATEGLVLPPIWNNLRLQEQWNVASPKLVRRGHFDAWVRLWFERQFLELEKGLVHVRSDLAATAACGHAVTDRTCWDLSPAMEYYDEALEAFVFPPIRIKKWWNLAGVLPGEIVYDFTPADSRFIPRIPLNNELK
jgi:hypothetical protein